MSGDLGDWDNMEHIQTCEDIDCELCEMLVTHGLVWACDGCQGLGNSGDKNEGEDGEVLCDPCKDKFEEAKS